MRFDVTLTAAVTLRVRIAGRRRRGGGGLLMRQDLEL
jgi:hypothetical protein